MTTDAVDVAEMLAQLISVHKSIQNIPEEAMLPMKKYEKMANHTLKELEGKVVLNKNTEALRNLFINDMLKEVKIGKVCLYCKKSIDKIQVLKNKVILTGRKTKFVLFLLIHFVIVLFS